MKTVNVARAALLAALKSNKEVHVEDYAEMKIEYQKQVIDGLKELLAKAESTTDVVSYRLDLSKPSSYEKDYDIAIGMLEMSVDENLVITTQEYSQYVLNEWHWSNSFAVSKSAYSSN